MSNDKTNWLQRPIHPALPLISTEIALFTGILLLAVVTRFYDLGTRVMSHDESLHTYFSWLLYRGQGYQHTPMMHGPWQFHWIALSYFLFGVSDFTARIPAALFSIATIGLVWYWRRYLGSAGMLVAAFLLVISPFMLFYGRYVREDVYTGFSGLLMLYSVLRYLEGGQRKHLYLVSLAFIIHFADKETSFIYAAALLVFLGILYVVRVTRNTWADHPKAYRTFVILLAVGAVLVALGLGSLTISGDAASTLSNTEVAAPANPTGDLTASEDTSGGGLTFLTALLLELGVLAVATAGAIYFYLAYIRRTLKQERSFDLMVLILTFVLPQLTALILETLQKLGISNVRIPTDAASVASLDSFSMTVMGIVLAVLFLITIVIGQLWNREWWKYAAVFWGIFTLLYTTFFTNAAGFFTGTVGSLGYWLVQQGVERGSQPEYYYVLLQIPMYEYLTALGSIVAVGLGLKKLFGRNPDVPAEQAGLASEENAPDVPDFRTFFSLSVFWVAASILTLTIAGERMPWLTYHMAWPMAMLTAWGLGRIIEGTAFRLRGKDWRRMVLPLPALGVFLLAAFNAFRAWYGATPPFQGTELGQLQATSAFIFPFVAMLLSGAWLAYMLKDDLNSLGIVALLILIFGTTISSVINGASLLTYLSVPEAGASLTPEILRFATALIALIASIAGAVYLFRRPRTSAFVNLTVLGVFALLAVQTGRTAFRAAYINYDDATEYLVYAHGATGIKEVMAQVEEISKRTAGGLNAVVAYDASAPDTGVSWPFVWYLRDFTALRSFDSPTRSLREAVAVIVDQKNFDKIYPALGDEFYEFNYIRMWWPNQDYFNLDRTRVLNAISNRDIRQGIFEIWFDRDYTKYSQATGNNALTLTTWQPADQMKLFVRKDVASSIWNYGVGPAEPVAVDNPLDDKIIVLAAEQIFGADRYPLGLNAPRAIARGENADFYVADSRNHRILHLASDGSLLHQVGLFADAFSGNAPMGTFSEPWGVAVGPDGSVYVTDTWNHRVQKFTRDLTPVKMWGQYGQPVPGDAASTSSFWGPRGIAVDAKGNVLVADTGNKRIVVFDAEGNYLTEFGTAGFDPGQFDEPVGVAVAPGGTVYVTDTWNQRIQAFTPSEDGKFYFPSLVWDVTGWHGQSLDNKPFIAVSPAGNIFITDPEGYRVIEYAPDGQPVRTWGDFGNGPEEIGLAAGVMVDQLGFVWVTDAGNNRILKYRLP